MTSDTAESFSSFSNVAGEDSGYRILHMSLSNNNYVLRRMGSVIGSNASHTWSPTLANYRYYIGRANSAASAGNYFNGKIGEICVYNNIISTEKRLIIESFMAKRWNLVDLLPLDHPARLTNIPIFLRGMSLVAEPNEYTNRGSIRKIFVLIIQHLLLRDIYPDMLQIQLHSYTQLEVLITNITKHKLKPEILVAVPQQYLLQF